MTVFSYDCRQVGFQGAAFGLWLKRGYLWSCLWQVLNDFSLIFCVLTLLQRCYKNKIAFCDYSLDFLIIIYEFFSHPFDLSMPNCNLVVSVITTILILISFFFLFRMIVNPAYHILEINKPRFICFILEHLFGLFMMIRFVKLRFIYDYAMWIF